MGETSKAGTRAWWSADGALLFESPEEALMAALGSYPGLKGTGIQSIWAVHPRLALQKWCYQHSVPWFILGEGLNHEIWRWPITKTQPSLLVVRYQPGYPFSLGKTQLRLSPLLELCGRSNVPMILDRQDLPAFLCAGLNSWLKALNRQIPLLELHTLPNGRGAYGALSGSSRWLEALASQQGISLVPEPR